MTITGAGKGRRLRGRHLAAAFAMVSAFGVPVLAAEPVVLVPHRAAYELVLSSTRGTKPIESAQGRIAMEFTGNACEGYAFNYRQVTRINDGEGTSRMSDLRSVTWEEGKGETFRFNTQSLINNAPTQATDGRAERATDGGISVSLRRPKAEKVDFAGDSIFPSHHMRLLIEAARESRTVVEAKVYDGSDGGSKLYDTTAIIGRPIAADGRPIEPAAEQAGLAAMRRWPVAISYFEPGVGERTPVYVLSFDMYENGVSGALKLDFGEFTLKGQMTRLDLLKAGECPK